MSPALGIDVVHIQFEKFNCAWIMYYPPSYTDCTESLNVSSKVVYCMSSLELK